MIKKIMSLLIIGILATGMIGCSNKKSDKEDKEIINEDNKDEDYSEQDLNIIRKKYIFFINGRKILSYMRKGI